MTAWQKAYSELKDFVERNPQIEISKSFIVIPAEVRPDFSRLFEITKESFIKENFPAFPGEAAELSCSFAKAAQESMKSLQLSEIKLPAALRTLIDNPSNGLTWFISDPLYDLLKGSSGMDAFAQRAAEAVQTGFAKVLRQGYEKWVMLSLLNLLSPGVALAVSRFELEAYTRDLEPDERRGIFPIEIPAPKKTEVLSLDRAGHEARFILGEVVTRSAAIGRYVSFGTDLQDAFWSAKAVSDNREWLSIRQVGTLWKPDIASWPDIVVYASERPEDIALVGDFSRFCRPDVIVECMEQDGWYSQGGIEKVIREYDFFQPKLGTFIVTRLPVPEAAVADIRQKTAGIQSATDGPRKISILTVGYDEGLLSPIVAGLRTLAKPG